MLSKTTPSRLRISGSGLKRLGDGGQRPDLGPALRKGTPFVWRAIPFRKMINWVVETVQSVYFDRGNRFEIDRADDLSIAGIPLLENILLNVLDNAIRHSPKGPEALVRVSAKSEGGNVQRSPGQAWRPIWIS